MHFISLCTFIIYLQTFQKLFRIQILKLLKGQENVPQNIPGYERPLTNDKRKKNVIIKSVNRKRHETCDNENSDADDDEEGDEEIDIEKGRGRGRGRDKERIREKMKVIVKVKENDNDKDNDTRIIVHQGGPGINRRGAPALISLMKTTSDSATFQCK